MTCLTDWIFQGNYDHKTPRFFDILVAFLLTASKVRLDFLKKRLTLRKVLCRWIAIWMSCHMIRREALKKFQENLKSKRDANRELRLTPYKNRSSFSQMFFKIGVLENFAKFTGKYLCQRLLSNKVIGWRLQLFYKRVSGTGVSLWVLWRF